MTKFLFSNLVGRFGATTNFPIKVSDVRDHVIESGFQDEIDIFFVDMDTKIARGHFTQFSTHDQVYGDPKFHTFISVAKDMSYCWQRFVVCKEMMHIYDKDGTKTQTKEDINQLAAELSSGFPGTTSESNNADRIAVYKALAILAPIDTVNKIRPLFANKALSTLQIAQYFRLPEFYIERLFSDRYHTLYDTMLDG